MFRPPPSRIWVVVGGVVVGTLIALAAMSGRIDPFVHTQCEKQLVATEPNRWIPAVLINSPYGGRGTGQGQGSGTTVLNGTAAAVMMEGAEAELFTTHNASVVGVGPDSPCTRLYLVALVDQNYYGVTAGLIATASNLTDRGEAGTLDVFGDTSNLSKVVYFSNAFGTANTPNVTTCGGGATSRSVLSYHDSIDIPFEVTGTQVIGPYQMTWAQTFTYDFPANFGTWAIDNLSAAGGPGGGWAFDFLGACS